jgi:hypothetical protein
MKDMNEHIEELLMKASEWAETAEKLSRTGSLERATIAAQLSQAYATQALAHRVDVQTSLLSEFFTWHYDKDGV